MTKKILKHLSNTENLINYLVIFLLIFFAIYERGLNKGILFIAYLVFFISGIGFISYIVHSINERNFRIDLSRIACIVFYLGYCTYSIIEFGFNKKSGLLLLPLIVGLIMVSGVLFLETNTSKRLEKWENKIFRKILSIFKK